MRSTTLLTSLLSCSLSLSLHAQGPKCLEFDGSQRLTAPNTALNGINTGDFTVEAWVNADETDPNMSWHPAILSDRPYMNEGFMFFFHGLWGTSNYKMLAVQLGGINYMLENNGSYNGSLLDGTCHHVAISRSVDTLSFYADGVLFGTRLVMTTAPTTAGNTTLDIGWDGVNGYGFGGNFSQVRVWSYARSAQEIMTTHAADIPGNTPGLQAYWPLNDGAGQIAMDLTGLASAMRGVSDVPDADDPAWSANCCPLFSTGVNGIARPLTLGVRPNPAEDRLLVSLDDVHRTVALTMTDAIGRVVLSEQRRNTNEVALDLGALPSGVYMLQADADGQRSTTRVVHGH